MRPQLRVRQLSISGYQFLIGSIVGLSKMNLIKKEIANLSHVSTRAIEMSRYRLRKILRLKKGEFGRFF